MSPTPMPEPKNPATPVVTRGAIAWFARNHVAANLLMIAVVVTGLLVARDIRQEVFPSYDLDEVRISMSYPGASPEEVERAVVLPIESEIRGLELVRRLESNATEGSARITIEIMPGFDRSQALQDVTAAVQRVSLFPDDVEPPVISLATGGWREVMRIALFGDVDEQTLVDFARELEGGLLAEPDISIVEVRGLRRPEIHIDVPQAKLRELGLTLDDVARTVRESAIDVPAGTLRAAAGDVMLKTTERRDTADEFADIAIISGVTGAKVMLSDIATIEDGFEDVEREVYFNGKRSVFLSVFSAENQPPLKVAAAVRNFIDRVRPTLPDSVDISLSRDRSVIYKERLYLLLHNGAAGLLLVVLTLGLFLELRVAFWTAIGIPISILGSLTLLPLMDSSINMISLFGFIITIGIVVDDAVVVGEDVFHKISGGMPRLDAAIQGTREMMVPVVFAVATNIIAFLPLLFVPGRTGRFFEVLPAVVIAVFTVSLVECLFILPAHLAGAGRAGGRRSLYGYIDGVQSRFRNRLDRLLERMYRPILNLAVRLRYATVCLFIAGLAIVAAYVWSGRIDYAFRPTIETDFIQAEIEMPSGTPVDRTREVCFLIQAAAEQALKASGEGDISVGIFTEVAENSPHTGEVAVTLVPQSERSITSAEFANLWREKIPPVPDLESLFFDYLIGPGGEAAINVQLAHPDVDTLPRALNDVAAALEKYPGVSDIRKGFGRKMPQLDFEIKPEGRSLGLTARELGRQIRHAFYGAEALRQPRDRDELRVMVRLPRQDRRSLSGLEELLIRTPGGSEIPLAQAATITETRQPVKIQRVDGSRVQRVTANVLPELNSPTRILTALAQDDLPAVIARYPGLRYSYEGDEREKRDATERLLTGLMASLFVIYALVAALLRSYKQAMIVILTIPWGLAGAVIGHIALGFNISIFSIFGMIALCGMVVNGAFVLAVTRNRYLAVDETKQSATIEAAARRFRPILLTAVTTFLGLCPMIFETSIQALFLVPMAISLGVGTLVSSVVVLVLIPAVFSISEDLERLYDS